MRFLGCCVILCSEYCLSLLGVCQGGYQGVVESFRRLLGRSRWSPGLCHVVAIVL